jgi:hypothetical protein
MSEYMAIAALMSFYMDPISDNLWRMFDRLCDAYLELGEDFMDGTFFFVRFLPIPSNFL